MENRNDACCAACGCGGDDLPWSGRGTNLPIAGCRFSLYPMSNQFIDLILGSLDKTDTSRIWSASDALSTVYRGRLHYVADAVKALFVNAYREGVHMAIEGQYSKGCPGDTDGDSKLDESGAAPNAERIREIHFPVLCKFSLYPMGTGDYIRHIAGPVFAELLKTARIQNPESDLAVVWEIHASPWTAVAPQETEEWTRRAIQPEQAKTPEYHLDHPSICKTELLKD